jgi:GDP-L-fucose synthase
MMNKKKIKIFITGHKGMVGSSLLYFLKKKSFGKILFASRSILNLENLTKVDNFIKKHKPDVIVNCAGKVGGILANSTYPTEFLNENILIQTNLIKSAYKNNVAHFINLGSSCIYPKLSKQPIKEDYLLSGSLEKTNEAYAIAKIVGLKLCEYYNKQFKTSYLTLMPCNLYGSNDNFDLQNSHFIPALIKKIVNAKKFNNKFVEIWGTGRPKREVMHVDDLSSAIFFIINKKISNDKKLLSYLKDNSMINIGSGNEYSIKQFASKIIKIVNGKLKLKFNKKFPDGTLRKILNTKFINTMGWKSSISLNRGLKHTIDWYINKYN